MILHFHKALAFSLKWEGGFANHPADPGGATNRGVTQAVYNAFRSAKGLTGRSVKEIETAEVEVIYHEMYWNRAQCDEIAHVSPELSGVHFDSAVNHGVKQAARFLQRAVGAGVDGVIGPKTMTALRASLAKGEDTTGRYIAAREAFYRSLVENKPEMKVFLRGWMNRVASLREFVKTYHS